MYYLTRPLNILPPHLDKCPYLTLIKKKELNDVQSLVVKTQTQPARTQFRQYLSCYWPDFDQTLKKAYWDHLEQIPAVTMTFVMATFDLGIFVHIRNISPVTDPILTKLSDPIFAGPNSFWTQNVFEPNIFLDPKFEKNGPTIIFDKTNFEQTFFVSAYTEFWG